MKIFTVICVALFVLATIGEVKCVVKAINCNWSPIGKAEVIYTASAFTGFGVIVGWFNIEDK
jgi:hypothetical protein